MNGIDKITDRINAEAKAETDSLLAAAREQAAQIAAKYQNQADAEMADLTDRKSVV